MKFLTPRGGNLYYFNIKCKSLFSLLAHSFVMLVGKKSFFLDKQDELNFKFFSIFILLLMFDFSYYILNKLSDSQYLLKILLEIVYIAFIEINTNWNARNFIFENMSQIFPGFACHFSKTQ